MQRLVGKHGTLVAVVALVAIMLGALLASGCGGGDTATTATTKAGATATTAAGQSAAGAGTALATEILAKFDEMVGKVAVLANAKPDPATLKPQVEAIYATYTPIMAELNVRYLALRDSDVQQSGECNSYLGTNRGKHTAQMDQTLTPALQYYNLELGDQAMVSLLTQKPIDLLNIAVQQK
jgi:hypothetical protein